MNICRAYRVFRVFRVFKVFRVDGLFFVIIVGRALLWIHAPLAGRPFLKTFMFFVVNSFRSCGAVT